MAVRTAEATWNGTLREGNGTMKAGGLEAPYTYASRFESGAGSNPEELVGAAHAGCFSMFLSGLLSREGHKPNRITTTARVHLGEGPTINLIELNTEADVPGIDDAAFQAAAEAAKKNCPVSKALAGPEIRLTARLVGA